MRRRLRLFCKPRICARCLPKHLERRIFTTIASLLATIHVFSRLLQLQGAPPDGWKKWTQHPPQLRRKLVKQGLDAQPIFDSNKLPGRSVRSIETILVRFYGAHKKFHAPHVNAGDIAELEKVVRFYVDAFRKLCLACVNIAV